MEMVRFLDMEKCEENNGIVSRYSGTGEWEFRYTTFKQFLRVMETVLHF